MCNSKKSKFIREREEKGLLSMTGELSILGQLLKQLKICIDALNIIPMNKIIKKFLLAGDKFMPGLHLRQHGFVFSACSPFTKKSKE